jgi:gluconate 2-dehydrogenase gamma chain
MDNEAETQDAVGMAVGAKEVLPAGRRAFFRKSLAIVPISALAACDAPSSHRDATATTAVAAPYEPRYFHPNEWVFVQAACSRLIPSNDDGPGALEAGVPEYIDRQMDTPYAHGALWYMQGPFMDGVPELGYQRRMAPRDLYRACIAAIDRRCESTDGRRFAALDDARRDAILHDLEAGRFTAEDLPLQAFFSFLLQNTREGYFCDPIHGGNKGMAAWKMIGFPGARADFMDWVGQHGKAYPFGPVDIAGRRS